MQYKWVVGEQLLSKAGGTMNRPMTLASLADSLTYLADDIHTHITAKGPKGTSSDAAMSPGSADRQERSRWRAGESDALFRGLAHLADQ